MCLLVETGDIDEEEEEEEEEEHVSAAQLMGHSTGSYFYHSVFQKAFRVNLQEIPSLQLKISFDSEYIFRSFTYVNDLAVLQNYSRSYFNVYLSAEDDYDGGDMGYEDYD